jgi:Lrp/AsnC family leucine-responsive transcriptional regulator
LAVHRLPDDTDWTLLRELSRDGRQTVRSLAAKVELSEPSVRERMQRLERTGVITGYHATMDPAAVLASTAAFVSLRFDTAAKEEVDRALRRESCVIEVHEVAGDDCYLLKLRVASTEALADALDRIRVISSVTGTSTTIVLRTVFERQLLAASTPGTDGVAPESP